MAGLFRTREVFFHGQTFSHDGCKLDSDKEVHFNHMDEFLSETKIERKDDYYQFPFSIGAI